MFPMHVLFSIETDFWDSWAAPPHARKYHQTCEENILFFVFLDPKCFRLSQNILFASALNWKCIFSGSRQIFCLNGQTHSWNQQHIICHTWHFLAGFIGDPTGHPQSWTGKSASKKNCVFILSMFSALEVGLYCKLTEWWVIHRTYSSLGLNHWKISGVDLSQYITRWTLTSLNSLRLARGPFTLNCAGEWGSVSTCEVFTVIVIR